VKRDLAISPALRSLLLARIGKDLRHAKWGSEVKLHDSNPEPLTFAMGHQRRSALITVADKCLLDPESDRIAASPRNDAKCY